MILSVVFETRILTIERLSNGTVITGIDCRGLAGVFQPHMSGFVPVTVIPPENGRALFAKDRI